LNDIRKKFLRRRIRKGRNSPQISKTIKDLKSYHVSGGMEVSVFRFQYSDIGFYISFS
jgi:hypothetical protein